ncbi:glycosyltransferase family 2 protein [Larkinella terrae]|uniref:Glycosyltransferase n=1 Tax=Larkinella terrae TaxID=2025311 RepID=A0A7K0EH85_9BACT|nr:glycosyltransferase family 2 protein [Larkinella terrae]MRS61115.1 glycosyltransferase [Larkinella terrae]
MTVSALSDAQPAWVPELSIILVSYNSLSDLQRFLPTLRAQKTGFSYEIIVVDNHGNDGVRDWIKTAKSPIRYYQNTTNSGYAGGNNLGLKYASGRWTLFLNPDTALLPDCLERLRKTAHEFPDAFITPKLLNPDGTINACGNVMHYTGITTCRGLNEPSGTYTNLEIVPLLSGAAFLAPTLALRRLGGFDETYFMYFEDTDLSLRARLAGYSLLCDARAGIVHHYKLGMNPRKFYHLERNRLLTFLKIFSRKTLLQLLPALLITEAMTWAYSLRGWAYFRARFQGYYWLWKNRPAWLQNRRTIQQNRQIPDQAILNDSLLSLPFEQLAGPALGRFLNAFTRPLFRLLRPSAKPELTPEPKTPLDVEREI